MPGSPKAVVSITPDTHVFIGESVSVRCDIQGGGDTQGTYSWKKNNKVVSEAGDVFYTDDTQKEFSFWSVKVSDSGTYTCSIKGRDSQISEISDAVTLTVSAKPTPTVRVNPQSSVYTGDTVTLSCELQQETGWEFYWYINNLLQNLNSEQENTLKVTVDYAGETEYKCIVYRGNYYTKISDPVNIIVRGIPKPVASINPDNQVFSGETVTLRCDIQDESVSSWQYSWYKDASHSPVSSGQVYRISGVEVTHTGKYTCRGAERGGSRSSHSSDAVTLTVSGESPPVSLIINPSRTQHFTDDSLSLSCEDQSNSTGWTVRRYTHSERVLDCSHWGSVTGSTCNISFLSTSYTGVYWCESESGENSNPVHITVHDGDVILESPVHPVTEGHPLTLRCLYHNPNPSNLRADFYKGGSVLQNQTTGEMIIQTVSKSDEGFYHCKHPERGESPQSWISVRRPSGVEAPFSVLMLICSVVTVSPYLLVTIILLLICYRARAS
ncbi:carcinoembryonic antigen-related cell adhesion molecule 5-like [Hemibagrus wyckioides]|uniref:carcinoembryonic antigen-related cell adhesion molecule 5-like n=1 Tax=Hemibagrus wyckioides TaxID=337641 RepID=UPI00266C5D78|nr:carcinoembryonic antigen-related cell adhesion molecule 5-like [Hemibagrus wyckioides]